MGFLGFINSAFGSAVKGIPVVGNALSGGLDYLSAQEEKEDNQNYQEGMMRLQHSLNEESAARQRDWSAQEAQKTRDWNDVGAAVQRAANAGLNPLTAVDAGGNSVTSVPSGSAAAPASPPNVIPNSLVNLSTLQQALQAKATSAKLEKETGRYDEQVDAQIDQILSDARLKDAQKDAQDLANDITRIFGKDKASLECLNLYNQALLFAAQGDETRASEFLKRAQGRLAITQNQMAKAELPFVAQKMRATINALRSEAKKNYEEARTEENKRELLHSQALTEGEKQKNLAALTEHEYQKKVGTILDNEAKDICNDLLYSNREMSVATFQQRVRNMVTKLENEYKGLYIDKKEMEKQLDALDRYLWMPGWMRAEKDVLEWLLQFIPFVQPRPDNYHNSTTNYNIDGGYVKNQIQNAK